jgi:hypothetical protein
MLGWLATPMLANSAVKVDRMEAEVSLIAAYRDTN